jgi:hypothetical protein
MAARVNEQLCAGLFAEISAAFQGLTFNSSSARSESLPCASNSFG